jgi:tripartite ATP-independent transporter DctM subunit
MTGGLIVLMAAGIPVSYALGIIGTVGYVVDVGPEMLWLSLDAVSAKMTFSLTNFLLLSIPFFILASKLMNSTGITSRIFNFANAAVGYCPGGLAHANIFASLIFSGMSGTAVSDAAGLGQIELKAMKDSGYDLEFSVGVTAASATIGPIFPPSVPMVVYSLISGASVGQLFLGGVVPGLLMTAALMVMVYYIAKKRNYFCYEKPNFQIFLEECKKVFLPLMTPVILLSGIWGGFFTPTEAAVVAFTYAFILSYIVYRETGLKNLVRVFVETGRETASIGFIVCASAYYGWILARSGVTNQIAEGLGGISTSPLIILLIINFFLLFIGCFMEPTAAILVIGPVLMPLVAKYGIDPVHFGVIMVLNLMIGLLTPPFGVVLFIMQDISGLPFTRVLKGTVPFMIPLVVVLGLITLFPDIVLVLPRLLMR